MNKKQKEYSEMLAWCRDDIEDALISAKQLILDLYFGNAGSEECQKERVGWMLEMLERAEETNSMPFCSFSNVIKK